MNSTIWYSLVDRVAWIAWIAWDTFICSCQSHGPMPEDIAFLVYLKLSSAALILQCSVWYIENGAKRSQGTYRYKQM